MAIAVVAFVWSMQHAFMPLTFDVKFMAYRLLASVPFSVFQTLLYLRLRRIVPFVIAHALLDGATVLIPLLREGEGVATAQGLRSTGADDRETSLERLLDRAAVGDGQHSFALLVGQRSLELDLPLNSPDAHRLLLALLAVFGVRARVAQANDCLLQRPPFSVRVHAQRHGSTRAKSAE